MSIHYEVSKLSEQGLRKAQEIDDAFDELAEHLELICEPNDANVQTKLDEARTLTKNAMICTEANRLSTLPLTAKEIAAFRSTLAPEPTPEIEPEPTPAELPSEPAVITPYQAEAAKTAELAQADKDDAKYVTKMP